MKSLLQLIRLMFEADTTNATKEKPWGNYAFGIARGLPTPKSPEPDTEDEDATYGSISAWVDGFGMFSNDRTPC